MIYCVEDERNIRELLVYTLQTTGFEAKGLESGEQLYKELNQQVPDLILLDIMMPGEDGYQILAKIKKMPEVRDVPVIMVTAKGDEFDKVKGLDLGAVLTACRGGEQACRATMPTLFNLGHQQF